MSDTAVAVAPRDPSVVESDMIIVQRHLRRKLRIEWGREDDQFLGTLGLGGKEWLTELSYKKKYDIYQFRMFRKQDHSDLINRQFDICSHNAYTLVNDVIAVHSTLRLIGALDLEQD